MKPKQLLPLVVILAVLAGLVAFREMKRKPPSIQEQYTLKPLLSADIDKAKIAKIEIYAGAKPDAKLVLERDGTAGKWKVSSKWDAPVSQEKIDKFLTTLSQLRGEFRATVTGDAQKEYSVDDAGGFHVIGYAAGAKDPLFHLINGKSPDFGLAFARAAGSDDVHVINVSLRREAGIYTTEMGDAPEAGVWLDKTVFDTPSEKIKAVALVYPDKEVAFELRDKPADKKPEEKPADAAKPAEPAKPAETAKEWAVAKGGIGTEFHANAGANLARRLSRINATDLVDPAKKADYGLQPPQYKATVTIEGQQAPVVIEAGHPKDDTYAYFHVAGRDRDLVYKVSGADFEQIFYKGGEFFELPGVLVDKGEVDTIEYTIGGRAVKLTKDGDAWKVTEPKTDVQINLSAIGNLVRTLLSWKAEDYADSPDGKGLDAAKDKVTFRGAKVEHTIALGDATPTKGRYAKLDNRQHVLAMSAADVNEIFAPYTKVFQSKVFDVDPSAISKITLTKGTDTATLERKKEGGGWTVAIGDGKPEAANEDNAEQLADTITGMMADDFDFNAARTAGAAFGKVAFSTNDGKSYEYTVEAEIPGGKHPIVKSGTNGVYVVAKTVIEKTFVDFAKLKPTPPPAPAAAGTPATPGAKPAEGSMPATPTAPAPATGVPVAPAPATPAPSAPNAPTTAAPAPAPAAPEKAAAPAAPAPSAPKPSAPVAGSAPK